MLVFVMAVWGVLLHVLVLCFWGIGFLAVAILRAVLPFGRSWLSRLLYRICHGYFSSYHFIFFLTSRTKINVVGLENIVRDARYLIIANHVSALDIIFLEHYLVGLIAPLKFFVKRPLLWVPIVGWVLYFLDYPVVHRYTKKQLRQNPELKGRDRENARAVCERLRGQALSFVNFVEGTRFSEAKHQRQASPYACLLQPKAGGISTVLAALHDQFMGILDVTLVYPDNTADIWSYLLGRYQTITIVFEVLPITEDLVGDFATDVAYRKHIQQWLNQRFVHKDALIKHYRG